MCSSIQGLSRAEFSGPITKVARSLFLHITNLMHLEPAEGRVKNPNRDNQDHSPQRRRPPVVWTLSVSGHESQIKDSRAIDTKQMYKALPPIIRRKRLRMLFPSSLMILEDSPQRSGVDQVSSLTKAILLHININQHTAVIFCLTGTRFILISELLICTRARVIPYELIQLSTWLQVQA